MRLGAANAYPEFASKSVKTEIQCFKYNTSFSYIKGINQ
jgi:hypothetical protein